MSFKQLKSSDILMVPTQLNKSRNFNYVQLNDSNSEVKVYTGINSTVPFDERFEQKSHDLYQKLIYRSINQLFYNQIDRADSLSSSGLGEDFTFNNDCYTNPIYSGIIKNFPTGPTDTIKVIRFNRSVIGEKIKPTSFVFSGATFNLLDDGKGNIYNYVGDLSVHVGNIFYENGIAIITDQRYQTLFTAKPVAVNDTYTFNYDQAIKSVFPLDNDFLDISKYIPNSLKIINPDSDIVVNDKEIRFISTQITSKVYYYTYRVSGGICSGAEESNVGKLTFINIDRSAIFKYKVEPIEDYCSFNIVAEIINYNKFKIQIESMSRVCSFTASMVDLTDLCSFNITAVDNDDFCSFSIKIEEVNYIPTPTPTPYPSPTPSVSVSATPGVTPTRTPSPTPTPTGTPTNTPTPTPTKSPMPSVTPSITPSVSQSNPNLCLQRPTFWTNLPFVNISRTGLTVNYLQAGVTSLQWKLLGVTSGIIAEGYAPVLNNGNPYSLSTVTWTDQAPGLYRFRIEGGNCKSDPEEIDVTIPTPVPVTPSASTPMPTPTSTTTRTPTPTPSRSAIPAGSCKTYRIDAGPGGVTVVRYTDCIGDVKFTDTMQPGQTLLICSITVPTNSSGGWGNSYGTITLVRENCDTSPLPTPMPTPSASSIAPTPSASRPPLPTPSASTPTHSGNVDCGTAYTFNGTAGLHLVNVNLGSGTGIVDLEYDTVGVPDRFRAYYQGVEVINTGFRGMSSYDAQLNTMGFPSTVGGKDGVASFIKSSSHPTLQVYIDAPIQGTQFYMTVRCPRPL